MRGLCIDFSIFLRVSFFISTGKTWVFALKTDRWRMLDSNNQPDTHLAEKVNTMDKKPSSNATC